MERGRAIWGLSHHAVADGARELVLATLIEIVDDTINNHERLEALYGLGQLGGQRAEARLRQFIETDDESDADKQQARDLLRAIKPSAEK